MNRTQNPTHAGQAVLAALVLALLPLQAAAEPALSLEFPGPAEVTGTRRDALNSLRLPIGPFAAGTIKTTLAEGTVDQTAWRISLPGLSSLQLMQPLRAQITEAGYAVIYECETEACGGFDFRYGISLLPEPGMHIDLGDFRYLAARLEGPLGPEFVSLIVSRSVENGFVQLSRIGKSAQVLPALTEPDKTPIAQPQGQTEPPPPELAPKAAADTGNDAGDFAARLRSGQSLALEDLVFISGSAALAEADYASLTFLSDWLRANPASKVMLVGHTDASGGLAANIALSKQRAQSVRQRLIAAFGIPASQIASEGVGYLAPRDSNFSADGKQRNRRVEVMLTSTP